ncbi:SDR family oxidoreductase [Halorhodospira halophila]|uniref:3-beta hydroxysteroid dehydrogenase/isomerase n=1 Tax=Halorhodospira halophila (strain DSM 244 / SL1) TaxID=349124 RepID=A1WVI7_HALHL|nr:SDR family oxidoreductase [Halorhodospira halophila]ABM61699.1 3-beta hydroxysteroid dehydrogenase/isomerase [Halorhodospira halophila SL1]MBK1728970.1 hypothetical protein [Halorhodospira halophila]
MKIAVFGGTRGVGAEVVRQALGRGWRCRVLARSADRVPELPGVEVVVGDVLDPEAVGRALYDCDGAVIALGQTRRNPPRLCSEGTRVIVEAMQQQGVPRVVAVSAMGVGDSYAQVSVVFRLLIRTLMKGLMTDKERLEQVLAASDRDWVVVRPGRLTNRPGRGEWRAGTDHDTGAGSVSRADVATFLLEQLGDDRYLRQAPYITG